MKLKEIALNIAQGYLGKGEEGKNNSGIFIENCLWGLAEPPANWCAGFVCLCYYKATPTFNESKENFKPTSFPFAYTLSARSLMNEFRNSTRKLSFIEPDTIEKLEPGDLIFFWRGDKNSWMGHVGIIEEIDNKFILTIEGNKGKFPSVVARYYYHVNHIPSLLGFGSVNL